MLIVGGNQSAAGGYNVDNSARFDDGSTDYLYRTFSSDTNRKIYTISVWIKRSKISDESFIIAADTSAGAGNTRDFIRFETNDQLRYTIGGGVAADIKTNRLFRDPSAWYHVVVAVDTSQGTSSNRVKMYINGVQETSFATSNYPSLNHVGDFNDNILHRVGMDTNNTNHGWNGYMSEFVFIDGQQLDPTDFGEFDTNSGIWKPIDVSGLTFGTNGFYFNFGNSAALGEDSSGNGNNFTVVNLTSNDQMADTCTNNFATFNSLDTPNSDPTYSEGNTKVNNTGSSSSPDIDPTLLDYPNFGGSLYAEFLLLNTGTGTGNTVNTRVEVINFVQSSDTPSLRWRSSGDIQANDGTGWTVIASSGLSFVNNDVVACAIDWANDETKFFKNGTLVYTYSYGGTLGSVKSLRIRCGKTNGTWVCNYGQDSSFAGNKTRQSNTDADGIGNFQYSEASNHNAICSKTFAKFNDTPIDKSDDYFNTVLYTGNGSSRSITGVNFQPDWVWIKSRNASYSHILHDNVRGATKELKSNSTNAEGTDANGLTSFNSDGFSLGTGGAVNNNSTTFVSWNWLASNTTASNTDGSITSTVSANTTSGFSIVSYSGNSTSGATVGHGLGVTPKIVIVKWRNSAGEWYVYSPSIGATNFLRLNSDAASAAASSVWNNTDPNSTTFTLGNDGAVNGSGGNYIAYCFAEIKGFSKFGKYTGNSSTDGTFVYTGFKPALWIVKRTDATNNWILFDNKRSTASGFNVNNVLLLPNLSQGENTNDGVVDFVSNGIKIRDTKDEFNNSSGSYIYMAFAENPFTTSTGIPGTAR